MARTRSVGGRARRAVASEAEGVNGSHAIEGNKEVREKDSQEMKEDTAGQETMKEASAPSAAPDPNDDVDPVAEMDAAEQRVNVDNLLPKMMKAETVPSGGHGENVVPVDEDGAKNEKKRVREKGEEEIGDESNKTAKAAKTETASVQDMENTTPSANVGEENEENGEGGVEVVEGAVIGEPGKTKRLKKRKIAMIIAYCGASYQGMQRNPGAITIEGELEQALYRSGAITTDNFGYPRKIDWMRAARTDKGVSAIGQVVSGQFIIEPEGFVERVNSFLPKDILVLGYKRVTSSFNAKKLCDKRRYEYIIPTYCFDPSQHLDRDTANALRAEDNQESLESEGKEVKGGVEITDGRKSASVNIEEEEGHTDGHTVDPVKVTEELVNGKTVVSNTGEVVKPMDGGIPQTEVKDAYKFDEAELIRLNRILARYKGTHNYHNFTARTQAEDPSAHRYIISFEADDTIIVDGIEFVRLHVIGQSFMLHQIRKMVGLAVAIMRGAAPVSVMDFALRKDTKFNVPVAPELGLFLEECYYASYNNKFKSSHEELSLKDFKDAVNEFKKSVIYPHIAATEMKDQVFPMWLHGINDRHFPDFAAAREGTYKPGNRTALKADQSGL